MANKPNMPEPTIHETAAAAMLAINAADTRHGATLAGLIRKCHVTGDFSGIETAADSVAAASSASCKGIQSLRTNLGKAVTAVTESKGKGKKKTRIPYTIKQVEVTVGEKTVKVFKVSRKVTEVNRVEEAVKKALALIRYCRDGDEYIDLAAVLDEAQRRYDADE